ncbi:MAG: glycosyltransferase family 39 protein [Acidobacteriota bacterium]
MRRADVTALAAALLYLLVPGHPDVPLAGIPLGLTGTTLIVLLLTVFWWARPLIAAAGVRRSTLALLAVATAGKLAAAWVAPVAGWQAYYYGNADFRPPLERSTDFRDAPYTRIDPRLDFRDTAFPVHFFNEQRFHHGFRREFTDPFSVRWVGYLPPGASRRMRLALEARGEAELSLDGQLALSVQSPADVGRAERDLAIEAGDHRLEVRYTKGADTEGHLRLEGDVEVVPGPEAARRAAWRSAAAALAWAAHAGASIAVLWWLVPPLLGGIGSTVRTARRDPIAALDNVAAPAVIVLLTAQGLWKARHLVDRVWTLTAGDDWMAFEHLARDILLRGLLMPEGLAIGQGSPFFYYPGYAYFVALAHAVTGESLAGVILSNFIMLALASVLVYRLARALFGTPTALVALVWLLALEQLDFVRYYTVTLLSENLFVFTVAATVFALTRFVQEGAVRNLALGAVAGGVSALTRPSIMLMLPLAAGLVALVEWKRRGASRAAMAAGLLVVLWMAAIAPATVRNYVMSGDPVLISTGQAATFVNYNLPSENADAYRDAFTGTLSSALLVLVRITMDFPLEVLSNALTKLGFSLGMVHWMGGSINPHPEFVLTSAAYVLAIVLLGSARSLALMPLHLFVATHLATLLLTMPSNYGYRLILPMYLFMPVVGAALVLRLVPARVARALGLDARAPQADPR